MDCPRINPLELCSRKLWQLVSSADGADTRPDNLGPADLSADDLAAAVAELARRRHYLEELRELGKLESPGH